MTKKIRIINDWRIMLHQKWEHAVLEEEYREQGNMKEDFRKLLQKEASKKGIEHLVITEEDFQKYIQAPSDDYEARGKFYTLEEEN